VLSSSVAPALSASPSSPLEPSEPKPGDTLLGVSLVEILGRGPNGTVWTARDTGGRTVAVKVFGSGSPAREARPDAFRRGVETLRLALSGERDMATLVRLYAVTADGLAFSFQYFDNGSAAGIPALHWDVPRTLEFFGRICRAVAGLHELGLVHRTLKPSNVLVDDDLGPVLTDPGMLTVGDPSLALDAADAIYRAPEELGVDGVQSPNVDTYALGRILWFLLQGSDPDEPYDAFAKLTSLDRFPPGLVRIVRKATAHDPAARYQWVEELEADLARYLTPALVGIGSLPPGADYPRYCVSSLPAPDRKRSLAPAAVKRPASRVAAPVERDRPFVRAVGWLGAATVLVSLALIAIPSAPTPELGKLSGLGVTLGLACSTLLLRRLTTSPQLLRVGLFGAALALLIPLEPDRLVLLRWKAALAYGRDDARAKAARYLVRGGSRSLRAVRLQGADLARADLGRADLRAANLRRANLRGANLAEADLARADLAGADLSGATLLSSNAFAAQGFREARCSRTTAMPSGWSCMAGHPASAQN
jgi:hypothetical protein